LIDFDTQQEITNINHLSPFTYSIRNNSIVQALSVCKRDYNTTITKYPETFIRYTYALSIVPSSVRLV